MPNNQTGPALRPLSELPKAAPVKGDRTMAYQGAKGVLSVPLACAALRALAAEYKISLRSLARALGYDQPSVIPFIKIESEGREFVTTKYAAYWVEILGAHILVDTPPRKWSKVDFVKSRQQAEHDQREADSIYLRSPGVIQARALSESGLFEVNNRDLVLDVRLPDYSRPLALRLKAFMQARADLFGAPFADFAAGKAFLERDADRLFKDFCKERAA